MIIVVNVLKLVEYIHKGVSLLTQHGCEHPQTPFSICQCAGVQRQCNENVVCAVMRLRPLTGCANDVKTDNVAIVVFVSMLLRHRVYSIYLHISVLHEVTRY